MASDASTPTAIHADRAKGTIGIRWADGHDSLYPVEALRWLCPCAYCRGEGGLPGWLDSSPTLTAEQTRLVDLKPVGRYALQPIWGDGHATGYYAFELLRGRCPCPECTRRRAAETDAAGHPAAQPAGPEAR
jgi:DUF971 family protein